MCRNLNRPVVDAYESLIGNKENVQHLKHVLVLLIIMLTISPTTAECERGFSLVNNIKSNIRTSLKQETLSTLVRE